MSKNIEIEIQVQIENVKELLAFLKKSARFTGQSRLVDTYFTPPHRNFLTIRPVNEWLRLRKSGSRSWLNYKNWHREKDGRTHYCDEYETVLENVAQAENIFGVLNFKPIVVVDKTRRTWHYKNFEIALDNIKGLGNFVEIEFKGKPTKKPAQVTKSMITFLKKFNPGEIKRNYVGYPFQLLFPKEVKYEVF